MSTQPILKARPTPPAPSASLTLPPEILRPLVAEIVRETLSQLEQAQARLPEDRLAFSEAEAARLLGLASHQLRDERLRGRIQASKIVGRQTRYLRDDLMRYLMRERTGDGAE